MGKSVSKYLEEGSRMYEKRLKHYISYSREEVPELRFVSGMSIEQVKEKEGGLILKRVGAGDLLLLLDERGTEMSSMEFASAIEKWSITGVKQIIFAIGGPYGFSDAVYARADGKLSLSKMTFPHQMAGLFFVEQLYRAMTIIKGEPYHHK